jgi:hypothetical protein
MLLLIVSEASGVDLIGSGTICLILRSRVLVAVRTVAGRMMPFAPGWTLMNLPIALPLRWGNVVSSEEDDDAFSYAVTALLHLFWIFNSC